MKRHSYRSVYEKDFSAPPVERKHIILIDGTWNDETGANADGLVTNIVSLNKILRDNHSDQIVRYHRGVGNDNDNGFWGKLWKGVTGRSVAGIVDAAYARFVQDWKKGDKIYIFGFSRGAAAARMLASKIADEGVPRSIDITLVPRSNRETKVVEQVMSNVSVDKSRVENVDIEFMGVWDTVSAFGLSNVLLRFLGLKNKDLFTDNHIATNIQKAVHLVAIDETRNPFVPSLMNHKEGVTHEVWFPGVHSDIGGSYKDDSLAKASLYYMIEQLEKWNISRGLKPFLMDEVARNKLTCEKIEKAFFHFHGVNAGERVRSIYVQEDGKPSKSLIPTIHQLYYDIAASSEAYSVITVREGIFGKSSKNINFQYMPFNIKELEGKFDVAK